MLHVVATVSHLTLTFDVYDKIHPGKKMQSKLREKQIICSHSVRPLLSHLFLSRHGHYY